MSPIWSNAGSIASRSLRQTVSARVATAMPRLTPRPAGRYPDAMARRISMALLLMILSVPAWAGDRDDKAAAERAEVAAKRSENAAVRAENAAAQVDAAAARLERLAEELERQQGQRRRRQHP